MHIQSSKHISRALRCLWIVLVSMASGLGTSQTAPDWLWITRHSDTMVSAAIHPSGQKFYTYGVDGLTKCWDTATGQVIWQTPSGLATLTLSSDGSLLILTDGRIRIYDTATNTLLHTRFSIARTSAFSPTENIYAAGSSNGRVQVFDGTTRFLLYTLVPPSSDQHTTGLAFSPDGRYLAIAGSTNGVVVWNLQTRTIDRTIPVSQANSLSYSPDGRLLAIGRVAGPISIYSFDTSSTVRQLAHGVHQVAFQGDGTLISAGTGLKRWDVSTGAVLQDQPTSYFITDCSISPLSGRLLAVGYGASVRTYNVSNFALEGTFEEHSRKVLTTDMFDGKVLFGSQDHSIRVWDLLSQQQVSSFSGFGAPIYNARIAPDRSYIAVSAGANVHLLDSTTGLILHTFPGIWSAYALAISPDGSKLARNDQDRVKVYDVASKAMLFQFGSTETVFNAAFTYDSKYLITSGNQVLPLEARVHETSTGHLLHTFAGPAIVVASSPVAPIVATVSNYRIKLYNVVSGQLLLEIPISVSSPCLAFSSDGRTLAVAGSNADSSPSMFFFDVATGGQVGAVSDLVAPEDLRFSDNDSLIAVAGYSYGVIRNPLLFELEPSSYAVIRGQRTAGDVQSLVTRDDGDALTVRLDTRTRGLVRADVEMSSASPVQTPRSLEVTLRAKATLAGLTGKLQMFDFSTQQWSTQGTVSWPLGLGYTERTVTMTGTAARFVSGDGVVKARLQVTSLGGSAAQVRVCSLDWIHWKGSR